MDEGVATRFGHFGVAPGAAMDEAEGFIVSLAFNGEWGNEGRGVGRGGGELTLPSKRSGRDFDGRDQGFGGGGRGRKAAPEGV